MVNLLLRLDFTSLFPSVRSATGLHRLPSPRLRHHHRPGIHRGRSRGPVPDREGPVRRGSGRAALANAGLDGKRRRAVRHRPGGDRRGPDARIKYWSSVSDDEQEKRFQSHLTDPLKQWKLSPMDLESRMRWVEYSQAKDKMVEFTDTELSP